MDRIEDVVRATRVRLEQQGQLEEEYGQELDWVIAAKIAERNLRRQGLSRRPFIEEIEEVFATL